MGATAAWTLTGVVVVVLLGITLTLRGRLSSWAQERHETRSALEERDTRLALRESTIESKARTLELRESNLIERERAVSAAQAAIEDDRIVIRKRLEEIADYTAGEARHELLQQIEREVRAEARSLVREAETKAQEDARRRSREIVATAVQRVATETTASIVTSTVSLPDEELKGRIIGRDGRNIRAFEHVTGVDVIVDDTPGAVLLSSFDPIRRETARRALETLVADGRIHPASIEAAFAGAERDVDAAIDQAGRETVIEAGVDDLSPQLCRLLGQLEYRTSYGQNVRHHSIEAAVLAGAMAEELGVDPVLARRCALLHDIGKALSHQVKGSHATVGAEVARRLGEQEQVCHAIAAHHGEVEPKTVEAVLTQAADAISAGRPGARRDALEQHCARLRQVEQLCGEFAGVEQVHAMQAGREVRIMVHPEDIDDAGAYALSRQIAGRIESELSFPGQIAVTVIRELRSRSVAS